MQSAQSDTDARKTLRCQLSSAPNIANAERQSQRAKHYELLACILAFVGLVALFQFAKPAPVDPLNPLITQVDFREDHPLPQTLKRTGRTTRNSGGADVLTVLGAPADQARAAIQALRTAGFLSSPEIGTNILLTAHFSDNNDPDLIAMSYRPNGQHAFFVTRRADGTYFASKLKSQVTISYRVLSGTVETTLADAIIAAGGTPRHIAALTEAFPNNASLLPGEAKGDKFQIIYKVFQDTRSNKNLATSGDIAFASYSSQHQTSEWYHYTPHDTGRAGYYTSTGQAARLVLNRQPVPHAKITSEFGSRTHPINGYEHLHTGVDFSAPKGTPVYAASNGTIREVTNRPGYGRYIRIKHASGIETAYAHLSGYERALHVGKRVKRGDLIGFVGNSGSVTGHHLHFEVFRNGAFVNPLSVRLPAGRNLNDTPEILADFNTFRQQVDAARYSTEESILLANNSAAVPLRTRLTP